MFIVTCFSVLLVSQWLQNFLTLFLVFSNSKILIVLILLCSIPSLNWAIKFLNWITGLLTYFNFVLVLSHYIATHNTHSLLFLYPNFDVFSVFIIPNDWHLRQLKKFIVVKSDDSIGGILLGNISKSDNPFFFFLESVFIFQD